MRTLNRREFLRISAIAAAGAAAAACQPQTVVVKETVEVQKEVTKVVTEKETVVVKEEVTKVVKEEVTKVVEKVVQAPTELPKGAVAGLKPVPRTRSHARARPLRSDGRELMGES